MKHKLSYCLFLSLSIGLFLGLLPEYAKGQATLIFDETSNDFFEANKNKVDNSKTFTARDEIKMKVNASTTSFKATTSNPSYTFKIDPTITPEITTGTDTYATYDWITNYLSLPLGIKIPIPTLYQTSTAKRDSYSTSTNQYTYTIDQSKPVGFIPGNGGVLPTGAASYTIPIDLPAGPGGVKPNLSISYNSMAGNGLLGWGFNLGGLSAITRTGQNQYFDGRTTSISLNADDKLALDGIRLLSNGTGYITENNPYISITEATGKFTVTDKTGVVLQYGSENNSSLSVNNTTISWGLSKSQDVNGNAVNYYYDADHKHIQKIIYGVNGMYELLFKYSVRQDKSRSYFANGNSLTEDKILEGIMVRSNGIVLKEYTFSYAFEDYVSKLIQIDLKIEGKNLNPTVINWHNKASIISTRQDITNYIGTGQVGTMKQTLNGDFNGDGINDLFITYGNDDYRTFDLGILGKREYANKMVIYLGKPDGTFQLILDEYCMQYFTPYSNWHYYRCITNFWVIDTNGDGKDEIVTRELRPEFADVRDAGRLYYVVNYFNMPTINGGRARLSSNIIRDIAFSGNYDKPHADEIASIFQPGDYDGDGQIDLLFLKLKQGNGSNTTYPYTCIQNNEDYLIPDFVLSKTLNITNFNSFPPFQSAIATNLDGDRKTDLICSNFNSFTDHDKINAVQVFGLYGTNLIEKTSYRDIACFKDNQDFSPIFGDFNGDGLLDIFSYQFNRNETGTLKKDRCWNVIRGVWINCATDTYTYSKNYSSAKIFLNTDGSFVESSEFTNALTQGFVPQDIADPFDKRVYAGDFNGDGKTDLCYKYDAQNLMGIVYSTGNTFSSPYQFSINQDQFNKANLTISDFNKDGKSDIGIFSKEDYGSLKVYYINKDDSGNDKFVANITNGFGYKTEFNYAKGLNGSLDTDTYQETGILAFPMHRFCPLWLVSSLSQPDGVGGTSTTNYQYQDGMLHLQGKGFLGFQKITTHNKKVKRKTEVTSEYDCNNFTPYQIYEKAYDYTDDYTWLFKSQTTFNYSFNNPLSSNKAYFKHLDLSYTDICLGKGDLYNTDGDVVKTVWNRNNYDIITGLKNWDLIYTYQSTVGQDGFVPVETIDNTYQYIPLNSGVLIKLQKQTNIHTLHYQTGNKKINSTIDYEYDPLSFRLNKQTVNKNKNNEVISTFDTYDSYGNVLVLSSQEKNQTKRTLTYEYQTDALHLKSSRINNEPGESYEYDLTKGLLTKKIGTNGLFETYQYDDLGNIISQTDQLGITTVKRTFWNGSNNNSLYSIETKTPQSPTITNSYDIFGRNITTASSNSSGNWTSSSSYNDDGTLHLNILPNFSNDIVKITTYSYTSDGSKRISIVGKTINWDYYNGWIRTLYDYDNLTTNVTLPDRKKTSNTVDIIGKLQSSTNTSGQTVNYEGFNAFGYPTQITANGSTTEFTFDTLTGDKLTHKDVSSGTIRYTYETDGKISTQTDARGNKYVMVYDSLSRLTAKNLFENNNTSQTPDLSIVTDYFLDKTDKARYGLPKTQTISSNNKISYAYDDFGRSLSTTQTIKPTNVNNTFNLSTSFTYDSYGRIATKTYPKANGYGYKVTYIYNSLGELSALTAPDGTKLWELNAEQANGVITQVTYGNGTKTFLNYSPHDYLTQKKVVLKDTANKYYYKIRFDSASGNVMYRTNFALKKDLKSEIFNYDSLDRLTKIQQDATSKSVTYDNNGNILKKYDAGYYTYDAKNTNNNNTNIYALSEIKDSSKAYTYQNQTINYNGGNKIFDLTVSDTTINSKNAKNLIFDYGPDEQRIAMYDANTQTTFIYGDDYEVEVEAQGNIKREWTYISSPSGLVAIDFSNNRGQGLQTGLYYTHTDHLGSVLMLTDASGKFVEGYNFDPWGRRRNPLTLQYLTAAQSDTLLLRRGFTFHEHLDSYNLINMNGRMYDPIAGRFLSPNEYVEQPENAQSYNAYSYCINNPLKFTDADGEYFGGDDIAAMIVGGAVNLVSAAISGKVKYWYDAYAYFMIGAMAGEVALYSGPGGFALGASLNLAYDYSQGRLYKDGSKDIDPLKFIFSALDGGGAASLGGEIGKLVAERIARKGIEEAGKKVLLLEAKSFETMGEKLVQEAGEKLLPQIEKFGVKEGTELAGEQLGKKLTSNEIGKIGQSLIEGEGAIKGTFRVASGEIRYVDGLYKGLAIEAKTGRVSLTKFVKNQILKDVELRATKQVEGILWKFYKSPVTGKGGPTKALEQFLKKYKIDYVIY
jgi:RHS repeat-associated protein